MMARGHQSNPSVNRYLKDKSMDHIDHALGRAVDPLGETYRNHSVTDGPEAQEFAASPFWEEIRSISGVRPLRSFRVTQAGRAALAAHLASLPNPHRRFEVSFDGHTWIAAAPTAAKAKYSEWLSISDVCPDLTFAAFCRSARVRRVP